MNERILESAEAALKLESDNAIQNIVKKARVIQRDLPEFAAWDGATCFDCTTVLPIERAMQGRVRCIDCQIVAELGTDSA